MPSMMRRLSSGSTGSAVTPTTALVNLTFISCLLPSRGPCLPVLAVHLRLLERALTAGLERAPTRAGNRGARKICEVARYWPVRSPGLARMTNGSARSSGLHRRSRTRRPNAGLGRGLGLGALGDSDALASLGLLKRGLAVGQLLLGPVERRLQLVDLGLLLQHEKLGVLDAALLGTAVAVEMGHAVEQLVQRGLAALALQAVLLHGIDGAPHGTDRDTRSAVEPVIDGRDQRGVLARVELED